MGVNVWQLYKYVIMGEIKRMRKQCIPGLPLRDWRPGYEANTARDWA